jgi:hypothetical protein
MRQPEAVWCRIKGQAKSNLWKSRPTEQTTWFGLLGPVSESNDLSQSAISKNKTFGGKSSSLLSPCKIKFDEWTIKLDASHCEFDT